jgi:hypothetical protein
MPPRAGVSVRSYGEFVENRSKSASGDVVAVESVPGLKNLVAPSFAAFDLTITDQKRVDTWLQEFTGFVQNGNLPHSPSCTSATITRRARRPGRRRRAP